MLDQMRMLGALAGLLKDKERLREAGERIRTRLRETRVTGEAGGGAVRVTMSGAMEVVRVELSPALAAGAGDAESETMAESLVAEATNHALRLAQTAAREAVAAEAERMGLGEVFGGIRESGLGGLLP